MNRSPRTIRFVVLGAVAGAVALGAFAVTQAAAVTGRPVTPPTPVPTTSTVRQAPGGRTPVPTPALTLPGTGDIPTVAPTPATSPGTGDSPTVAPTPASAGDVAVRPTPPLAPPTTGDITTVAPTAVRS